MTTDSTTETEEVRSFPRRHPLFHPLALILLYLALAAYFYSFASYGLNVWDEGGYAYGTLRTLNGQKAMVDFNPSGYLPGRYVYGALFFKLLGIDIQSLRIGVLLFTPAMIFMVFAIARRIMPSGFSLLAALFMFSAPSMYYNRFFTFFCVVNLYCLLRVVEKRQAQRYVLLVGAVLLSGFFKFEVALFSFLCCVMVLLAQAVLLREKQTGAVPETGPVSGMSRFGLWGSVVFLGIVLASALAFLSGKDFFNLAVRMVLESHRVWGNPFPDLFPFLSLWKELGPHEMFQRLLFYIPVWVYAGVAILLTMKVVGKKTTIETIDLHLLAILLFGICAFGLVLWRAGFDNLLRTLPPAYILFCYFLHLARNRLLSLPGMSSHGADGLNLVRKTAVNVMIVFLPFLFFYEMNVHHGFYAGSIGAMKQETAPLNLERMKVYTNPSEAEWIRQVVDRIEVYSEEGEPILALPLNPIFYFLTGRENPTPYDWILPGMLGDKEEAEVVRQLKANPPKVIVYVDIPIDGKEDRRLEQYAPRVFNHITENYVFEEMIGFFQILLPKTGPG